MKIAVLLGDIDNVLLTHLHEDHLNGLIDEDGAAIFLRAEIVQNFVA